MPLNGFEDEILSGMPPHPMDLTVRHREPIHRRAKFPIEPMVLKLFESCLSTELAIKVLRQALESTVKVFEFVCKRLSSLDCFHVI
jgi:hypothetical protein